VDVVVVPVGDPVVAGTVVDVVVVLVVDPVVVVTGVDTVVVLVVDPVVVVTGVDMVVVLVVDPVIAGAVLDPPIAVPGFSMSIGALPGDKPIRESLNLSGAARPLSDGKSLQFRASKFW
jgi:hypothetical protein